MKTILVVGVNGFVGKHLARELHDAGLTVHGTGLDPDLSPDVSRYVDVYTQCDLTLPEQVATIPLDQVDGVINLAALATPSQTSLPAELYFKVNVLTHTTLLDRLVELGKNIRILAVSTGAVYDSNQPMPLTEASKLVETGSPYALSKIELEKQLETYRQKGCEIVVARPLNHTGPGQGPGFIVPDLTSRILAGGELTIGPMNTSRDYTHVDDVVHAYRLLLTHPEKLQHSVYNICSGMATSRDELIALIEKATGQSQLQTRVDPSIGRPSDPMVLYGSHDRIRSELGWNPTKSLEQTIQDYVDWLKSQPAV